MLGNLYFLKFNNYYNRQLKLPTSKSINDYAAFTVGYLQNTNFNPNDGVNTIIEQLVERPDADYVLYSEDGSTIDSKWYIIDSERETSGLWKCFIKRDVVADYYNEILNADTFIEKAILPDSSPLIFNKENISVNQIKKNEELIKDESGAAWIVGYLDRKYEGGNIELTSPEVIPDISIDNLDNWKYYKYTTSSLLKERCYGYIADETFDFEVRLQAGVAGQYTGYKVYKDWVGQDITSNATFLPATTFTAEYKNMAAFVQNKKDTINETVAQYRNLYYTTVTKPVDYNEIKALNGKFIFEKASEKYFKIEVVYGREDQSKPITEDKQDIYLYTWLRNQFADIHETGSANASYRLNVSYAYATIKLQQITGTITTHKVAIPGPAGRLHCKDAPFDMFIIPFIDDMNIVNGASQLETPVSTNSAGYLALSQSMAQQLGTNLYDLQLLPFCPATGFNFYRTADGQKYMDLNTTNKQRYTFATDSGGLNYMPIIWCTASSGNLTTATYCGPRGRGNRKLDNECKMYRIVSGNYSATFEYNPQKFMTNAEGAFTGLNVDFTYLPYQPFIRIAPKFTGLYGSEFHDARGLIISGDFSLMYTSDAWVNYKTQNKNFQEIFNREISSMELQNDIQMQNAKWEVAAGVFSAGAGGVAGGVAVGGGLVGGAIGAAAGGAMSLAAGIQDLKNMKILQEESINYKKDLFGYQLGNIRALPNSIAKTTAYNIINKIFPIIEFYECSPEEKKAVANKIAWNSMTVMAIGKISDYIGNSWKFTDPDNGIDISDKGYIKGSIIRLNINDDYHLSTDISEEINKGWYFK